MTATTLGARPSRFAGLGRSGGDAQERAATNPMAALPCAHTPSLTPCLPPCLSPCLDPQQPSWGCAPSQQGRSCR